MVLGSEALSRLVGKEGGLCWGGLGLCKTCCLACDAAADDDDDDNDDVEPGGGGDNPMGYLLIPNEYLLEKTLLAFVDFGEKEGFFTGS